MEYFLAYFPLWLIGSLIFWFALQHFTRLRGGAAAGVTLMVGSLPVWLMLLSVMEDTSTGSLPMFGIVLLFALIGGVPLVLGAVVMLLSTILGNRKKETHAEGGQDNTAVESQKPPQENA